MSGALALPGGKPGLKRKKKLTFAPIAPIAEAPSAVPSRDPRMVGVSTVAKQIQRRREAEVRDLELARRARQSKECTVLDFQVESRRDQLKRLLARKDFLQDENRRLAEEIIGIEGSAMGRVHTDLQQTVNTLMSGQTMNRQYQRDLSSTKERVAEARSQNASIIRESATKNKHMDMLGNLEATSLKELLAYRRRGLAEDEKFKARLVLRFETVSRRLAQDLARKEQEIERSVNSYKSEAAGKEEQVLSRTTDQTVAAMDSEVMSAAAVNIDVRKELEIQSKVSSDRVAAIKAAKAENIILKAQLAATAISLGRRDDGPKNTEFSMLPSRVATPPNQALLAKMRGLAMSEGYA